LPATFTVLVTTRDRPALLADALASIARQALLPIEIRLADTGAEPARAHASARGVPLLVLRAPGLSAAEARNLAAQGAASEAFAFLDDDDRWLPDHLAGLAQALSRPGARFAFRDSAVIRERVASDGAREDLERRTIERDWDEALMQSDDYLPPSAWGLERSLLEELGGFDTAYRFSDDWDFLLRARRVTLPVRSPGVTVEVRMREAGNASADFGPERLGDLRRLEARHGLPRLVPKTFWEVAETVRLQGTVKP
jgi:glycosyltransferase involved in cell wall biosynthesis